MSNFKELVKHVLKNSVSSDFKTACLEWEITDELINDSCGGVCVCGKCGLKFLFEIKNRHNNNILYPIGSECILKFESKELSRDLEKLLKPSNKIFYNPNKKYHGLTFNYISKKDPQYINFLKNNAYKTEYRALCDYHDTLQDINKRKRNEIPKPKPKRKPIILSIMEAVSDEE